MECSERIQITLQKIGFTHDDFIRIMKENIIKLETQNDTEDSNFEYKIENIPIQECIKLEFHENEQDGIPDVSKLNIEQELSKDLQDKENNLLKECIELQFPENSKKDITKSYKINILNLDFRHKLNGYELYDLIQYFFSKEYGKNVYPEPYYISNVVAGYTCYESSQIFGIGFKDALLQKLRSLKIFSKFFK